MGEYWFVMVNNGHIYTIISDWRWLFMIDSDYDECFLWWLNGWIMGIAMVNGNMFGISMFYGKIYGLFHGESGFQNMVSDYDTQWF